MTKYLAKSKKIKQFGQDQKGSKGNEFLEELETRLGLYLDSIVRFSFDFLIFVSIRSFGNL